MLWWRATCWFCFVLLVFLAENMGCFLNAAWGHNLLIPPSHALRIRKALVQRVQLLLFLGVLARQMYQHGSSTTARYNLIPYSLAWWSWSWCFIQYKLCWLCARDVPAQAEERARREDTSSWNKRGGHGNAGLLLVMQPFLASQQCQETYQVLWSGGCALQENEGLGWKTGQTREYGGGAWCLCAISSRCSREKEAHQQFEECNVCQDHQRFGGGRALTMKEHTQV